MNPVNQISATETPSESAACNLQPATCDLAPFAYRGNGKVARLPKTIRDLINTWLRDGVSYPDIIDRLGDHGKDLKPDNLSEWKKRGHQDWLLAQAWLAQTRARQEPAADLASDTDATQLNHAALQLGSLHIFEAFRDLTTQAAHSPVGIAPQSPSQDNPEGHAAPAAPTESTEPTGECPSPFPAGEPPPPNQNSKTKNQKSRSLLDLRLGGDSAAFVRLLNALARASRETMLIQKYRDACARARAALRELKDPKRKLTDDERRHLILQVDEILGLPTDDDGASSPQPVQRFGSPLTQPEAAISPTLPPPIENQIPTTENPPPAITTAE